MSKRGRSVVAGLTVATMAVIVAGTVAVAQPESPPVVPDDASGAAINLGEYVRELRQIEEHLKAGDSDGASGMARALKGRSVICAQGEIEPDPALLHAIEETESLEETRAMARRVDRVARALEAVGPSEPGKSAQARPEVLAGIRRSPQVEAAGRVALPEARIPTVPERLLEWSGKVIDRLSSAWKSFKDWARKWLRRLWPTRRLGGAGLQSTTILTLIIIAVATAILALTALRAWRAQSTAPAPSVPVVPVDSERDADPLSRESNEWEGYAQELARTGRRREAIRAWYHAVLVALFRGGYLHHERGRTNWEYAARLGPELSWRPVFLDLTRQFDREWYGRAKSSAEALAHCARAARAILHEIPAEAPS